MSNVRWPVSVKGVVPIDSGVVLLRNERDEWELPGGRLEPGESPEQCVAREIREELGIDVEVGSLIDAWVYPVLPGTSVLVLGYGCAPVGCDAMTLSAEQRELGVLELHRLGELSLPEGYRRTIERWASAARTPPV